MSPRFTSLETLNGETELGYRVTPAAKYPFTRAPESRWRTRVINKARTFRVFSTSVRPPKRCSRVLGCNNRISKDMKPLRI